MATFTPVMPVFAALPDFPSVGESLEFQLNGLVVVFIALGAIWELVELMGWVFRRVARAAARRLAAAAPPPAPPLPAVPAPEPEGGLLPELAAAITAAVFVVTEGRPHRVTAITPIETALDWAREGRRAILASHQPANPRAS